MTAEAVYSLGNDGASLADTSDSEHTRMLGARAGCSLTEDSIDMAVKRFLRKEWKTRRRLTHTSNAEFGGKILNGPRAVSGPSPPPRQKRRRKRGKPQQRMMEKVAKRRKSRYSIQFKQQTRK